MLYVHQCVCSCVCVCASSPSGLAPHARVGAMLCSLRTYNLRLVHKCYTSVEKLFSANTHTHMNGHAKEKFLTFVLLYVPCMCLQPASVQGLRAWAACVAEH